MIDHTLLKPESTAEQIEQLCAEAGQYHFGAVCVNSCWVALAAQALMGSGVKVAATIGFPWGTSSTGAKVAETRQAIADGAREVDMVLAYGKLKSRAYAAVAEDIREVVRLAHRHDVLVKVILETSMLNQDEKVTACLLARQAGADFVKTSTGFNGDGATVEQVEVMLKTCAGRAKVKPSGGIRDWDRAVMFLKMGVGRLGVGSADKILDGAPAEGGY
jgi:deoxyribose-phosphate aldolase